MADISPAEIQKFLAGVDYPADRDDLVEAAEGNSAPPEVLAAIRGLPDEDYNSPTEVMVAFGEEE